MVSIKKKAPRVSVLMSVYNAMPHLRQALDSIVNQTFLDFEFLIVDDASSDDSLEILELYEKKFENICLFRREKNKGICENRRMLLNLAKGDYIAIMDADDISKLDRLETQINYLDSHPNIAVVGSNNEIINEKGTCIGYRRYLENITETDILKASPVSQPSVMFRRDSAISV
jgi:glycosyltransferase involved in cell wall biosynthesis